MDKENALDFWDKYELIVSTKNIKSRKSEVRFCRFCDKNHKETSFRMMPHALPELLGKNKIVIGDECDNCNKHFNKYESHLAKFLGPFLTMGAVKGKRKIPTFESRTDNNNPKTKTIIKATSVNKREINLESLQDYKIDKINKTLSLTFRLPPHKLSYVYKAFVKIGLSILPDDQIANYKTSFNWLLDDKSNNIVSFVSVLITLLTARFEEPYAEIYKSKKQFVDNDFLPELVLLVGTGNVLIQCLMPLSDTFDLKLTENKKPALIVYPAFAWDRMKKNSGSNLYIMDLKGDDTVTYDRTLNFSFQSGEFGIIDDNS